MHAFLLLKVKLSSDPVRPSVGWSVWSVCHNFLSGRGEVSLACSYRSTCLILNSYKPPRPPYPRCKHFDLDMHKYGLYDTFLSDTYIHIIKSHSIFISLVYKLLSLVREKNRPFVSHFFCDESYAYNCFMRHILH